MATIDKLEYINNTKNLIKNALNTKFNSQIGDGDTFRSYAQKIDDIYENWPKVSEEDTNFTLNSTKEGKMKIDLKGNTNQDTNIITYTCLGTETGDYYFVYNSINYQFTMPTISANDVLAFNTDTLKLYLDTTEITTTTASTGTLITMNTTPNPNYPQDIHIVSGDNTIEVQGKNLLHLPNGTITNRGITGTISNDNILTYSGTASSSYADITSATRGVTLQAGTYMFSIDQPQLCRIVLYVSGEASFNTIITVGKTSASFTLNEPKIINYRIGITGMTSKNSYSGTIKMQLEKNNKATTYESYQSQSYPISLGNIELCKIEDYQDSIIKDNNKWYLNKQIGKYNNPIWNKGSSSNVNVFYSTSINNYATSNNIPLSNNFIGVTNVHSEQNMKNKIGKIAFRDSQEYIRFYVSSNMTETELNNLNTIVYYVLDTPTYTEITDSTLLSQLNALEKAISYNEQTNITQTNNDLPFILNVSALEKNSSN